jgi:hypothetical protein
MNYVPLQLNPRPFHTLAYESLAVRGVADLEPIFADWNLEMPAAVEAALGRASSTTKANARQGASHRQRIDSWKRVLSTEQVERILRVVRDFGLDFYGRDAEPDYERLQHFRAIRAVTAMQ